MYDELPTLKLMPASGLCIQVVYMSTLNNTSNLFEVMILSMIFVGIQVHIYPPEVAAPGFYNTRGTMACL